MRRAALVAALVLAGCGGEEREAPAPAAPAATEVTITVVPGGTRTIRCPGDNVCARLRRADLSPTPATVACTEVYGGDATARVRGRIEGRPVDARFDLHNGCEIARWERLSWLLGDPPSG